MSGLINSLAQGASAAGYGAGEMYGKMALEDQRAEVETMKAQRMAEFADNLKNAPLKRLGESAQRMAATEVPVEAEPVKDVSGVKPDGSKFGFTGDIKQTRGLINSIEDPAERAAASAQLDRQVAEDTTAAKDKVAGKTRRRTSDEALDAAVEEAKLKDLPAVAAYESQIGRPARDERRVANAETKEENRFKTATAGEQRKAEADARKAEVELKKLDLQQGNLDAQNRKIDGLIEHWERSDEAKGNGDSKPDKLGAIVNAMNATVAKLTSVDTPRGKTDLEKAEWQKAYDNAVRVRDRATKLLDSSLTDRGAPEQPKPAAPGAKPPVNRPPLASFQK